MGTKEKRRSIIRSAQRIAKTCNVEARNARLKPGATNACWNAATSAFGYAYESLEHGTIKPGFLDKAAQHLKNAKHELQMIRRRR